MNKINIYIVFLLALFTYKINANATNYLDINKYDYTKEGKVYYVEGLSDIHNLAPTSLIEDSDGNIIFVNSYREENSKYADNDYTIPNSAGNGTGRATQAHAKIGKIDSNYNLVWETKFYQTGNWENADPLAETTKTGFSGVIELSDGSYLAGGSTGPLLSGEKGNDTATGHGTIHHVGIIGRFSNDGKELFRQNFLNEKYGSVIGMRSLNDGGYIIKMVDYNKQIEIDGKINVSPTQSKLPEEYYYVYTYLVFDSNNQIIDKFSERENDKLNYLNLNKNDLYKLKYSKYYNTSYGRYIGMSINNEAYFMGNTEDSSGFYDINIYNPDNLNLIRTFNVGKINGVSTNLKYYSLQGISIRLLNDGTFMYGHRIFDSEGNLLHDYLKGLNEHEKEYLTTQKPGDPVANVTLTFPISWTVLNGVSFLKSNGDWVFIISNDYRSKYKKFQVEVKSQTNTSEDFANFIINGEKIERNLGTFIENDRTYISLNNLCGVLDCTYKRSKENKNKLIIDFDIFNRGNNKMVDITDYHKDRILRKPSYTIVHEIGSKSYTSYLAFQPLRIFRLNSPTYNENEVDVASIEKDGQIYVPLRFISEALGRYVTYEPAKDGGKPTITIGAYGEGEFYEKYGVALSYDKLNENDTLTNPLDGNKFELRWAMEKLLYGYGYLKTENKVISVDKTIFVPGQTVLITGAQELEYNDLDDSLLTNNYQWASYESKDNWIGKQRMYKDDNGKEGEPIYSYGDENYAAFFLVSNIEGYPFIKIVNLT